MSTLVRRLWISPCTGSTPVVCASISGLYMLGRHKSNLGKISSSSPLEVFKCIQAIRILLRQSIDSGLPIAESNGMVDHVLHEVCKTWSLINLTLLLFHNEWSILYHIKFYCFKMNSSRFKSRSFPPFCAESDYGYTPFGVHRMCTAFNLFKILSRIPKKFNKKTVFQIYFWLLLISICRWVVLVNCEGRSVGPK